MTKKCVSTHI